MASTKRLFDCFKNDTISKRRKIDNPCKYAINKHTVLSDGGCIHEVVYKWNENIPHLLLKSNPAKTYKFKLDTFQKQAILCIDNNQSVLVSAHTSAGKTVVAEYAIASCLQNKQRIIYTTPIKALSNQKYRELSEEFKDVGLMTGDVTIEPNASCIVMTTEILRNMLYRGSHLTKEVAFVIFDEIHYMRDEIRGMVWEETIILLPDNVRHVFLSATIPNARQFGEWVCFLHNQPCNIVYTEVRPTPLQHHIFPVNAIDSFMVIDENSKYCENKFAAARNLLSSDTIKKNDKLNIQHVKKIVKIAIDKDMAPLIIFSFSKTECEQFAVSFQKSCWNNDNEQNLVSEIFNNAISLLAEDERKLPHVTSIFPLLKKGIAFHHSGLLPIIKEIIEILFGEGLIKTLFATETFAMGLNMPARTVIFTNLEKFDGTQNRFITSGEYIQMSGRAGRRGIDDKGIVIALIRQLEEADKIKEIISGKADPLNSAFRLTNYTILNLLRQDEINPEYIIEKSFLHFQNTAIIDKKSEILEKKEKNVSNFKIQNEDEVCLYVDISKKLSTLHEKVRNVILKSRNILSFLNKGRLVKLRNGELEYEWGIISDVKVDDQSLQSKNKASHLLNIKINVFLETDKFSTIDCETNSLSKPFSAQGKSMIIHNIDYFHIYQISTVVVDIKELVSSPCKQQKKKFTQLFQTLSKKYPDGFPLLHPITDMKVTDKSVENIIEEICVLENELMENPLHKDKSKSKILKSYRKKIKLLNEIDNIKSEIDEANKVLMLNDLTQRKAVLRLLGYCDEKDFITIKGRISCEFSTDEILLTEIILSGILNEIPVDNCVALLSCLACQENTTNEYEFDEITRKSLDSVRDLIASVDAAMRRAELFSSESETIHEFQPHMINVILAWCRGASFLDACQMTGIYEGSIIRYMRNVEEILKQLFKAAKNIGNTDLEVKFSEGIKRLKRGIVFAASLYL